MRTIALDYETFFSDDYTLKKLTTEAYIRDKRFVCHGAAVKWSKDHAAKWYDERQLRQVLKEEDWSDVAILCHHAQFDGFILAHHFGVKPKFWLDTLSMARLLLGNHISVSLDSVRKYFNIPSKRTPYDQFKGRRWHELSAQVQQAVADGACDEVESIWTIFGLLLKNFPREELEVIDLTVRMFTEPALVGDIDLLAKLWESEAANKQDLLQELGATAEDLQSAAKFQALLEAEGVEIEYKDGKKGRIPCFAKTDEFMKNLLEDESPRVQALASGRLGIKSTLLQTRASTLGWMASRGPLCVYLRYAGARTLRFSGGDKSNFQNFKRSDPDNPKAASPLRRAICAPEGYWLAPVDSSQIECRVLNYLAGQEDVIEKFKRKEDPYVGIATAFYGRPITRADANERGTGKQAELSCGYGCGPPKFKRTAALGIYGPPVNLSDEDATRFVTLYRDTHRQVVDYWNIASRYLARLAGGPPLDWGPLTIRDHRIFLPNGTMMIYDTINYYRDEETGESYWRVRTRNGWEKLYGAKLVQNICEAVSRVIVTQAAVRIKRMGFRILNIPHDELLVLIPKGPNAERDLEACKEQMRMTPDWLPGLPLDVEGHLSERYEK